MNKEIVLSEEQNLFIEKALEGKNILVNACIGSGKTTAIQHLCQLYPSDKKILYLTYNKLLKLDAKEKITNPNVIVTNYHGFAYSMLFSIGISAGVTDLIQVFLKEKPQLPHLDLLLIDEYQDINQELSEMLEYVKDTNPNMQIIAVGDMDQKIYDYTMLDVSSFIKGYLEDYVALSFTNCFRLNASYASKLGRIWHKTINGVNDRCSVVTMNSADVVAFLSSKSPSDVLCLGSRSGDMPRVLNDLEERFPAKFNKNTVFASIVDKDQNASIEPDSKSAIFTTYDSSKGLERKICILFDFTEEYWSFRANTPGQSYTILRNIFCVAASRGKEQVILVENDHPLLSEQTLSLPFSNNKTGSRFNISEMFNFRYKEKVEECYSLLSVRELNAEDRTPISIKNYDGLIDLSPCIGIYQEASFFRHFDVKKSIENYLFSHREKEHLYTEEIKNASVEKQILFLTALETHYDRYNTQVSVPFIKEESKKLLHNRLSFMFAPDEDVQKLSIMDFSTYSEQPVLAIGLADVVKDGIVYELKFVSDLTHEHFLQCACYVIALKLEKGILWNTRTNRMFEISIRDRERFFRTVLSTIQNQETTKKQPQESTGEIPRKESTEQRNGTIGGTKKRILSSGASSSVHTPPNTIENSAPRALRILKGQPYFAVIDTETNWNDAVMSIGLVIGSATDFSVVKKEYYILYPEVNVGGMYSDALRYKNGPPINQCKRQDAIRLIKETLTEYRILAIFAYNASFDWHHLPELSYLVWFDIMRIAAYKQYNSKLSEDEDYFGTGKLKRNFGVEPMYRLLTNNYSYREKHNAVFDAVDELEIMSRLRVSLESYFRNACISHKKFQDLNTIAERENIGNLESVPNENQRNNQRSSVTHTTFSEEYGDGETCDTKEAAELLGVSVNQVYQLIRSGKIDAYKKKNKYCVLRQTVLMYQAQREHERRVMRWTAGIAAAILLIMTIVMLFQTLN